MAAAITDGGSKVDSTGFNDLQRRDEEMSGDAKEALKLFVAELVKERPDQKSADKAYRGILFEFREEYLEAFAEYVKAVADANAAAAAAQSAPATTTPPPGE